MKRKIRIIISSFVLSLVLISGMNAQKYIALASADDSPASEAVKEAMASKSMSAFKAFPNPFTTELTITYMLKNGQRMHLGVYNLLGQQVHQITREYQSANRYQFTWNGKDSSGKDLPRGMYYIILSNGQDKEVLKVMKSR